MKFLTVLVSVLALLATTKCEDSKNYLTYAQMGLCLEMVIADQCAKEIEACFEDQDCVNEYSANFEKCEFMDDDRQYEPSCVQVQYRDSDHPGIKQMLDCVDQHCHLLKDSLDEVQDKSEFIQDVKVQAAKLQMQASQFNNTPTSDIAKTLHKREVVSTKLLCIYNGLTEDCKEEAKQCQNEECSKELEKVHDCLKDEENPCNLKKLVDEELQNGDAKNLSYCLMAKCDFLNQDENKEKQQQQQQTQENQKEKQDL